MLKEAAVFINKLWEDIKKVLTDFLKYFKAFLESLDINKYIRYKKHEKRVENRKKLYAKRKARYGK